MTRRARQVKIASKTCAACGIAQPVHDFRVYRYAGCRSRQTIHVGICDECLNFAGWSGIILPGLMFGDTNEKGWQYLKQMRQRNVEAAQ